MVNSTNWSHSNQRQAKLNYSARCKVTVGSLKNEQTLDPMVSGHV